MSESVSRLATDLGGDLLRASLLGMPRPVLDDRFAIQKVLGRGVSGVVVSARDERLRRDVAIKLTPASAVSERMLDEARALAQLRRPECVVQVWEATRGRLAASRHTGELHCIVMELVVGVTLREWQAQDRTAAQILNVYGNVAVGLDRVHTAGIAHGDVKPDNVIVDDSGVPTLVDFGFAANVGTQPEGFLGALSAGLNSFVDAGSSRPRDVVGTPPYMAPEVRKGDIRRESDVHAYAVSLWEALTGEVPFHGEQAPTSWFYVAALPGEEHVPRLLRRTLKKAMQPEPWVRPNIAEVHAQVVHARQLLSRQPTRWGLWLVVVLCLGALGVGALAAASVFSANGGNGGRGAVQPVHAIEPEAEQTEWAQPARPQSVPAPAPSPDARFPSTARSAEAHQEPLFAPGSSNADAASGACAALATRWQVSVWVTDPQTGRRTTAPDPSFLVLRHQGGCRYALVVDGDDDLAGPLTLQRLASGELVGSAPAPLPPGTGVQARYRLRFQGPRVTGHFEVNAGAETEVVYSFAGFAVM